MAEITKIEVQKNNSERFNVFLDGKFAFPISSDGLVEFKLKVKDSITDEQLKKILNFEVYDKLLNRVLGFISYRPRSRSEIDKKIDLLLKDLEIDEIVKGQISEKIIKKLKSLNLYNDNDIATLYVENSKNSAAPLGANKIKEFLFKKGVDRSYVEDLLSDYLEYEIIGARKEFIKKAKKSANLNNIPYKEKMKICQFLAGKGYSWNAINAVIDSNFEL